VWEEGATPTCVGRGGHPYLSAAAASAAALLLLGCAGRTGYFWRAEEPPAAAARVEAGHSPASERMPSTSSAVAVTVAVALPAGLLPAARPAGLLARALPEGLLLPMQITTRRSRRISGCSGKWAQRRLIGRRCVWHSAQPFCTLFEALPPLLPVRLPAG
jgi:hypothetical protein